MTALLGVSLGQATGQTTYELSPGDMVDVQVLGQPDMSGAFSLDADGMISVPILGGVKASGLTADELERKLVTLLADGYVKRPQVTLRVETYQSQRVFVTGEIERPGPYGIGGDQTLLNLVREIGAASASGQEVVVIRPPLTSVSSEPLPDGESDTPPETNAAVATFPGGVARLPNYVPGAAIFRVNLTELLSGNPEKNLPLVPGDTVYFAPAFNVYITGHVVRPGSIRYRRGLTVFQAMNEAGGLTARASKKIKVIRFVDGHQLELRVEMTDLLQPEDTVVVSERFF